VRFSCAASRSCNFKNSCCFLIHLFSHKDLFLHLSHLQQVFHSIGFLNKAIPLLNKTGSATVKSALCFFNLKNQDINNQETLHYSAFEVKSSSLLIAIHITIKVCRVT
jgi:hypothetical protein